METNQVPQRDKDAELKIIAGLRTQGIEVESWEWSYDAAEQQWQLRVRTSWSEEHGQSTAMRALEDALVNGGIDADIAARVRLVRA